MVRDAGAEAKVSRKKYSKMNANNTYLLGLLRPPDFFNRLTVRKKTG